MKKSGFLIICFILQFAIVTSQPVTTYPANPHYLMYKGHPLLLITSDQHYGEIINREFNYIAFLDKLKSKGLNFTRIYPGAYIEKADSYLNGNVLGPRDGKQILPWKKTTTHGAHPVLGGYKFDLDTWDEEYFDRLTDFCDKARERDIIIEICFFNGLDLARSDFQAMRATNNIQGTGICAWNKVYSLEDTTLVSYQEKYIKEIARRLNDYDNVMFHIADEPWESCGESLKTLGAWIDRMANAYVSAESILPKKHMLGQTVNYRESSGEADFSRDSRIKYIDVEYVKGKKDIQNVYRCNKPVILIETNYYPIQYKGDDIIGNSRVEAWDLMIDGCAGFMQLNGLYSTDNANAQGTEIDTLLDIFVKLRSFMGSVNIFTMECDTTFIVSGAPAGVFKSAMSEPGKQYILYVHHSKTDRPANPSSYIVVPGNYQETFTFKIPAGSYNAEWVDPVTGSLKKTEKIQHKGGSFSLTTPIYKVDIALRMKKISKAE